MTQLDLDSFLQPAAPGRPVHLFATGEGGIVPADSDLIGIVGKTVLTREVLSVASDTTLGLPEVGKLPPAFGLPPMSEVVDAATENSTK